MCWGESSSYLMYALEGSSMVYSMYVCVEEEALQPRGSKVCGYDRRAFEACDVEIFQRDDFGAQVIHCLSLRFAPHFTAFPCVFSPPFAAFRVFSLPFIALPFLLFF